MDIRRNYNEIAEICKKSSEPVFLGQNGGDDLVIMSRKSYEEKLFLTDVYGKLAEAEAEIAVGKVHGAQQTLTELRDEYEL